jgi:hypothetical protein
MLRKNNKRMPDVLDCLANLSNDEVFTPPEIANRMLDLLPQEVFESKEFASVFSTEDEETWLRSGDSNSTGNWLEEMKPEIEKEGE